MTLLRTRILLAAFGIFAAAAQLIATRWGLIGDSVGGFCCGLIVLAGKNILASESAITYFPPLLAALASLAGLGIGMAGSEISYPNAAWLAPLLAALPFGLMVVKDQLRGARCQLCHGNLRGLLSFLCPRCHLTSCENCWQFERGRCRLCDSNQVPLFPLDSEWWQERFGSQARGGRCALCLRAEDWQISHWACANCGNGQCRTCWDDNNGQCSRCGWVIPDLPHEISEYVMAGSHRERSTR